MKKNKLLVSTLLAICTIGLSGCSLFNDADIEVHNEYNPAPVTPQPDPDAVIAGGVVAKSIDAVPNTYCFKSICYAENEKIDNTYTTGEFAVNGGEDYSASRSSNNYDLYVPKSLATDQKHTVILFIHGGAWVTGFKTDVNQYVYEFAKRGYITATIKYTLLKRSMDDPTRSIFRNLDEIDACIKSIKSSLEDLEFDTTKTKLVIGGASSGSHLSMLYAYSRGQNSALPISFLINAVGPVDIKPINWKRFTNEATGLASDPALTAEAMTHQTSNLSELSIMGDESGAKWNEYQTMRIANGMVGMKYTLEEVEAAAQDESKTTAKHDSPVYISMTKAGGGEDLLSVTYWINKGVNKFPIVCAYACKDSVVGVAQYKFLDQALVAKSIEHQCLEFRNSDHVDISHDKDPEKYDAFITAIANKLAAL